MKILALLAVFCVAFVAAPAVAQSVRLVGPDGQVATIGAADLAGAKRIHATLDAHGEKHVYEGVLLIDLLAKVATPVGAAIHGKAMATAVLVKASDGYQVVFGLGELDPGTRANPIILADSADGRPLAVKEGPFKLVVDGDLRPARAARMVTEIDVIPMGSHS